MYIPVIVVPWLARVYYIRVLVCVINIVMLSVLLKLYAFDLLIL